MNRHVFFLVYRRKLGKRIRWDKPIGGLVMRPDRFVEGHPVADFGLAFDVVEQRHHCAPYEELIVAEVFEREDRRLARRMAREFEREFHEFQVLMESSRWI